MKAIYKGAAKISLIFLVLSVVGIFSYLYIIPAFALPEPFTINEHTIYGLTENEVHLNITENLGKNQIINISNVFRQDALTDQISYKNIMLNQSYQSPVFEWKNISLGKYSKTNLSFWNENTSFWNESSGQNQTIVVTKNRTNYLDISDNILLCDYTLADKSCLKTTYTNTSSETKYDYLPIPDLKTKAVIAGLKIEQKQEGIPLPKNSKIQIKYIVKHPIAYRLNVSEDVNKYNITVTSADGIDTYTLDPTWYDNSYNVKYNLNMTANSPLSSGHTINMTFDYVTYNKCGITGNDTRIVINDVQEIDRNITSNGTANAILEFKLDTAIAGGTSNTSYDIYCQNPTAGNPPNNKSNVYGIFDGFEEYTTGSTNAAIPNWKMNTTGGTINITADVSHSGTKSLKLSTGGGVREIFANNNTGFSNFTMEVWSYLPQSTGGTGPAFNVINSTTTIQNGCYNHWGTDNSFYLDCYSAGARTANDTNPVARTVNQWYNITVRVIGTKNEMWADGLYNTIFTSPSGWAAGDKGIGGYVFSSGGTVYGYFDDFLVRKWVENPPTITIGAEETANSAPKWSNNQSSIGALNALSNFNTTWTDDSDANGYNFSFFELGFPNGTSNNYTAFRFPNNISHYNLSIFSRGYHNFSFYANDSSNKWNKTSVWKFLTNANETTTNNATQTSWNETFTGNQNNTFWINVPKYAQIIDAKLNLSGYYNTIENTSINYSFSQIITNNAGGIYNNSPYSLAFDDDYGTSYFFGAYNNLNSNWYIEANLTIYNIPSSINKLNYTRSYYDGSSGYGTIEYNESLLNYTSDVFVQIEGIRRTVIADLNTVNNTFLTISQDFINNNNLTFKMWISLSGGPNAGRRYIYEFDLLYDSNSSNPYLDVAQSGNKDWQFGGEFNQTNNRTANFSSEIQSYLSTCTAKADGTCDIPFVLHSDTAGKIQISDISVVWYMGNRPPNWLANSTSKTSPQTYNPTNNYGFQTNWTDDDNNFANATFQLGRPNGNLLNYTDNRTGLVGYWRLNAVNGTNYTLDFTPNHNDGRLYGYSQCGSGASTCNLTAGKIGNALQFDGVNDYVDAGNAASLNITNAITIEAWVNVAASKGDNMIITKRASAPISWFLEESSGTFIFQIYQNDAASKSAVISYGSTNEWYHIVGVANGTNVLIYVNGGTPVVGSSYDGTIKSSTNNVFFGIDSLSNSQRYFNGTIDEVRIWNRSLSAAEIAQQYAMQYPYYAGTDDSLNGAWAVNFTQSAFGGAGTYNYTWFGTDSAELQNKTDVVNYIINQNGTNPINLFFRNATNQYLNSNMTITYESNSNTTAVMPYQQAGTLNLYRDDVLKNIENNTNTTLGAGTYKMTANTSGNANYTSNSSTYYIIVNQKNANIQVSPITQTITYETSAAQYCSDDALLNCQLFRNGALITNNTNIVLGNATYNYEANISDTTNYTNWQATSTLKVNKKDLNIYTAFNQTINADRTYTYPQIVNATGWKDSTLNDEGILTFYRNGTVISGSDVQRLGNTTYNYTLDFTATNYTANRTTYYLRVNKAPNFLTISPQTQSIAYENSVLQYCSDNTSTGIKCSIFRNATNITTSNNTNLVLGFGIYNFTANITDTQNYTVWQNSSLLTVNKAGIQILISPQTSTINYETSVNQYCSDNATLVNCSIYRNSTNIVNDSNIILGFGIYNFTANITDDINYTIMQNSSLLTVNKKSINIYLSLNGTQSNVNYIYPDVLNATVWKDTTLNDEGTLTLLENGTSKSNPRIWQPSVATYNYSVYITASNYSATSIQDRMAIYSKKPISLTLSPTTQTITYPSTVNQYCSDNATETDCTLWKDNINITGKNSTNEAYGVGTHNFKTNISLVTENYTWTEQTSQVTVNQNGTNPISLWIMNNSHNLINRNISGFYPLTTNTTAYLSYQQAGTVNLSYDDLLNNTLNNTNKTLAAKLYKITANTSGNENYTSNSTSYYVNIFKLPVSVRLFLDGNESNKNMAQGKNANFTATVNISANVSLDTNISGWNIINTLTPLYNTTRMNTINTYNITAYAGNSENYSGTLSQTYYITVISPLTISNPAPTGWYYDLQQKTDNFYTNFWNVTKNGAITDIANITFISEAHSSGSLQTYYDNFLSNIVAFNATSCNSTIIDGSSCSIFARYKNLNPNGQTLNVTYNITYTDGQSIQNVLSTSVTHANETTTQNTSYINITLIKVNSTSASINSLSLKGISSTQALWLNTTQNLDYEIGNPTSQTLTNVNITLNVPYGYTVNKSQVISSLTAGTKRNITFQVNTTDVSTFRGWGLDTFWIIANSTQNVDGANYNMFRLLVTKNITINMDIPGLKELGNTTAGTPITITVNFTNNGDYSIFYPHIFLNLNGTFGFESGHITSKTSTDPTNTVCRTDLNKTVNPKTSPINASRTLYSIYGWKGAAADTIRTVDLKPSIGILTPDWNESVSYDVNVNNIIIGSGAGSSIDSFIPTITASSLADALSSIVLNRNNNMTFRVTPNSVAPSGRYNVSYPVCYEGGISSTNDIFSPPIAMKIFIQKDTSDAFRVPGYEDLVRTSTENLAPGESSSTYSFSIIPPSVSETYTISAIVFDDTETGQWFEKAKQINALNTYPDKNIAVKDYDYNTSELVAGAVTNNLRFNMTRRMTVENRNLNNYSMIEWRTVFPGDASNISGTLSGVVENLCGNCVTYPSNISFTLPGISTWASQINYGSSYTEVGSNITGTITITQYNNASTQTWYDVKVNATSHIPANYSATSNLVWFISSLRPERQTTNSISITSSATAETNWTIARNSTDYYIYNATIEVPNNNTKNREIRYVFDRSRLTDYSSDNIAYTVDGNSTNLSYSISSSQFTLTIPTTFNGGQSLDYGNHTVIISYLMASTTVSVSGGGTVYAPAQCNIGYQLIGNICQPTDLGFTVKPDPIVVNVSFAEWFSQQKQIEIINTVNRDINLSVETASADGSDKWVSFSAGFQNLKKVELITLNPKSSFSGGSAFLTYSINIPQNATGTYQTDIILKNLANGRSATVRMTINITEGKASIFNILAVIGVVTAALMSAAYLLNRRKKRKKQY